MRVSRRRPFLEAAAEAMEIDRLRVIDAAAEPAGQSDHWDDGSNILAIGRRLAVCHERNSRTNERLEAAGITVIRVPGSELGSVRGGPRCMACAVSRDPAVRPADDLAYSDGGARPLYREALVLSAAEDATGPLQPVSPWSEQPVSAAARAVSMADPSAIVAVPSVRPSGMSVRLGGDAMPLPDQRQAGARQPAGQSASQGYDEEQQELAKANLAAPHHRRRRAALPDLRPIRNTPRIRPSAKMTNATMSSHHNTCMMVTTTKNSTIAAPINAKMRSMSIRYGPSASAVSTPRPVTAGSGQRVTSITATNSKL
jgi:hypothetical protein